MISRSLAFLLAMLVGAFAAVAAPIALPVYLEDNHAGSFYWLAQKLDLDEECTLVLFDAHSDASGIFDSDDLREQLRRVYSASDREKRLEEWRRDGVVQCFGWIEPLMPAPFARVVWVPGEKIVPTEAKRREGEAIEYLDNHLEAAPRRSGSFQNRYSVAGLEELRGRLVNGTPLVVTLDLDYFAGMEPVAQAAAFERVWQFITERRNLRAVTIAVSRPYLTDDAEANRLVKLALDAAISLPTATVEFEPFSTVGNDQSLLATELRKQHRPVPFYDVTHAPQGLRSSLLANRDRISVRHDSKRWDTLLHGWESDAPRFELALRDAEPSTDGIWRVPVAESPQVEIRSEPTNSDEPQNVEWVVLAPAFTSCNLTAQHDDEPGFAIGNAPRPRWREVVLPEKGTVLDFASLKPFFDAASGCGSVRLKARVRGGGWIRETPMMEIRRFSGTGFRAAITEQFGLPYLFGSGQLQTSGDTGPETAQGADCANFVVYALRRQGLCIPWCDPKQLRPFLEPVASPATLRVTKITQADLENGLIVHLGSHVAVVMEDRPPLGVLDDGDLVAHHLEKLPEVVPLRELLKSREGQPFDLLRVPKTTGASTILIGGDVMLARTVGERIKTGVDPFTGLRALWTGAAMRVVNLECVISDKGVPTPGKRYVFRAPTESAHILGEAGVNVVGLANNHAGDFGGAAILDTVARLKQEKITSLGAARTREQALAASVFPLPGNQKMAILAVNALEDGTDKKLKGAAIASSTERAALAAALTQAHEKADWVICLVHWGEENSARVTEEQRHFARWLIDHGADAIAGCHSHCVQPLDFYHGHAIAYSLGNLVFDGAPSLPSWNHGELLELGLSLGVVSPSVRMIPLRLDAAGLPQKGW